MAIARPKPESGFDGPARRDRFRQHLAQGITQLGEEELRGILADVVAFGPSEVCRAPEDVVVAAERLGYPIVLKVSAPGLLHKSDLGLVRLGISSGEDAVTASTELLHRAESLAFADAAISVQPQLSGVEISVGVRRGELGIVCVVAAGGTLIELMSDSAAEIGPVSEPSALRLLERLRMAPLLRGYRGSPEVNVSALARLVAQVSEMAAECPELAELDLNPVFVSPDGCLVADGAAILAPDHRPDASEPRDLTGLLAPRSIAVIGAGSDRRKAGGLVVKYLSTHGYNGEIVAVNPRGATVEGATANVRSLKDFNGEVDLACIAVPAESVAKVVEDCVEHGVPYGIIYSAGSIDAASGSEIDAAPVVMSAGGRFRFVGPNSMGVAVPPRGVFATFGMAMEISDYQAGVVGFVSQSGALASSLFSRSRSIGVGFSHWISVGNEADLGIEDFIFTLAGDDTCRVICLFVEAIRRPLAFEQAARAARGAGKPVIVFKTGSSEAGKAAAMSHTGAMTGSDESYEAFFRRCGVLRVNRLEDLFIVAHGALTAGGIPGNRVAIISTSGGGCSVVADACARVGLEVPELDERTQARLRGIIPPYGGFRNPIDITAMAIWQPSLLRKTIEVIADSGLVDVVLVQLTTNADPGAATMAADLIELTDQIAQPILVGRTGSEALAPEGIALYRRAGVRVFEWPEQLATAAWGAVTLSELLADTERRADGERSQA